VGKQFDAVWVRPPLGTPLEVGLRHAATPEESLAKAFSLGTLFDVSRTYVSGNPWVPPTRLSTIRK
jgi:guanine deaminase